MKVHLLADDNNLFHALEKVDGFEVNKVESVNLSEGEIFVISDRIIHHNDLYNFFGKHDRLVFYLVSNQFDTQLIKQVKTICNSLNIHVIKPRLTTEQIVIAIYETVFPERKENTANVVAVLSTISNVGVTSSTLSIAAAIQSMANATICVIGNNAWDDGTDQIANYRGKYLDEIKTQLTNRMFDKESFLHVFHKDDKLPFYYLAGNQNSKIERLFTIEEINYLIELAKDTFDLVLIDAGSHFDNANIIQSLYHADLKLLIVNQQRKAIKKFNQIYNHILQPLGYSRNEFLLVINRYVNEPGMPNIKDILDEINIPYITSIPDASFLGVIAETNQQILFQMNDREYVDSIYQIARGIVSRTDLEIVNDSVKSVKKKWFSFNK